MKTIVGYPPNHEAIKAKFKTQPYTCYAYGDTIYNPAGNTLPPDLLAHEAIHSRQQGDDPQAWWDKYLNDPIFRFDQELEAYQEQYQTYKRTHKDRNDVVRFLHRISVDFSSNLYGRIVSYGKAFTLIKNDK